MTFKELYASGRPCSIEFFPPRTPETMQKLLGHLPAFQALKPSFCSLTMGAGGSATADATLSLIGKLSAQHGLDMVCHFTCVGKSRDEIRTILGMLRSAGIDKVIALRGDPPKGQSAWTPHPQGFHHSVELVREVKAVGGFSVAVAGFPETHPEAASPQADLDYLKAKVDAGADVVITQLFFDNDDYFRFVDRARKAGVTVPIVPGILPIRTVGWVRKFVPMCGAKIPPAMEARLQQVEGDDAGAAAFGIEWALAQTKGLKAGGAPGFHFCALNDPAAVVTIFREAGLNGATA